MPGFEVIGQEEKDALAALFDEGGVLFAHGFGPRRKRFHVREFEAEWAARLGGHALAVSSGTAAIKVALKALGVGPGDEVITQCFNFVAGLEAIVDCGAVPVIAGSDATLNMDPDELEDLITDKTRAIMPVHMLGVPAHMDRIMAIAAKHEIPVLEDACEAVGAWYDGKEVGTVAEAGVFSFDFGKTVTCGEGGLVLLRDAEVARAAVEYHDHGHMNLEGIPRGQDRAGRVGFNYRMSEMNAVVGKVQLGKLDMIIEESRKRYAALDQGIRSNAYLKREIPEKAVPAWDTFIIEVPEDGLRERVIAILNERGFGTKNLPDAMRWHCSVYWDHMGFDVRTPTALATEARLKRQVAMPVWLDRSVADYAALAEAVQAAAGQAA